MLVVTAPGWYPDVVDRSIERYWDGGQWTPATRPVETQVSGSGHLRDNRPKPVALIIAGIVVVLVAAGILTYWFGFHTSTMTVRGVLDLNGKRGDAYSVSAPDKVGDMSCAGIGGYSDIQDGAEVVVTDGAGKTLAIGHLDDSIWMDDGTNVCMFGFQVSVPTGHDFYGIEVTHRGVVQFSRAEMRAGPDLSLGR